MAKIKWMEPYEQVRGKFSKKSNLINKLAGNEHMQISHRQGERRKPYSTSELEQHKLFSTIAKKVAVRRKNDSATYDADLAAFALAQKNTGVKTFQKWLWLDEMSKLA